MNDPSIFPHDAPEFAEDKPLVPSAVPLDSSMEWIKQGWAFFSAQPSVWIATSAIFIAITVGLFLIPFVGVPLAAAFFPFSVAGFMNLCARLSEDKPLEVTDFFEVIRLEQIRPIAALSAFYALVVIVIYGVLQLFGWGNAVTQIFKLESGPLIIGVAIGIMLLIPLLILMIFIPMLLAIWLFPMLVLYNKLSLRAALGVIANALIKNILPFFVYGIILLILSLFAIVPAGVGFLVLIPVLAGAAYAAYHDIFVIHP